MPQEIEQFPGVKKNSQNEMPHQAVGWRGRESGMAAAA
jgi:hypothetical protein